MRNIREQRDLASLSEPRFICTAPARLRRFAVGVLIVGASIGGIISIRGLAEGGSVTSALGGAIVAAISLSVLVFGRPNDWRVWINLAATTKGLYLVALKRRVVFVPWQDDLEIGVERIQTHRGLVAFLRLALRLPEEGWGEFGNLSAVTGTGAVRQYLLSALAMPGDTLIEHLKDFRRKHC